MRTYLVFIGHSKLAFTSDIEEFERGEESNTIKFYTFNPTPIDRATGNEMLAYKTSRIEFIYLVTYHGAG